MQQGLADVTILDYNEFSAVWNRKNFTDTGYLSTSENGVYFFGSLGDVTINEIQYIHIVRRPFYWIKLVERIAIPLIVYVFCLFTILLVASISVSDLMEFLILPALILSLWIVFAVIFSFYEYLHDQWLKINAINKEGAKFECFFSVRERNAQKKGRLSYLKRYLEKAEVVK